MSNFDIEFFEKENGSYPAEDFILSQDKKMQVKLYRTLQLLEIKGNELREHYSKKLTSNIFEIRVKFSSNISRVLYFFVLNKKIILTNGFIKKTQKTPKREIEIAEKYRLEYLKREGLL